METKEEILDVFIKKMVYLTDERVLGVVRYDGYIPGYSCEQADAFLYIITNNENIFVMKNRFVLDELKVEYYERSLDDLYRLADISSINFISPFATIVGFGNIICDKTGRIKSLQNYIIEKYSVLFSEGFDNNLANMEKKIIISLGGLKSMLENNSPVFSYNYYLLLEQIKQFYIRLHHLDDFTTLDLFMLSSNLYYQNQYNGEKDDNFFRIYIDSLVCEGSNLEKFGILNKLYNYVSLSKGMSDPRLLIK